MCERPSWLPEIIKVEGNWFEVVQRLYAIFDEHFKKDPPMFQQWKVVHNPHIHDSPYEDIFWHLIGGSQFIPEFRRAERIGWCRALIVYDFDPCVCVFDYPHNSKSIRTCIWLQDYQYAVFLEKNPKRPIAYLITAYYVEGPSNKHSLKTKYNNRITNQGNVNGTTA